MLSDRAEVLKVVETREDDKLNVSLKADVESDEVDEEEERISDVLRAAGVVLTAGERGLKVVALLVGFGKVDVCEVFDSEPSNLQSFPKFTAAAAVGSVLSSSDQCAARLTSRI